MNGAYRLQSSLSEMQRIVVEGRFDPEIVSRGVGAAVLRALNSDSFAALRDALVDAQAAARRIFEARIGRAEDA